jgi:hypothetical protein|nr:MAG TPA: hypothetical protein [Caudoviricetes sp.]
MIQIIFRVQTDTGKYVTSSTIEYRLFGILLCKKTFYYPPENFGGEYFRS